MCKEFEFDSMVICSTQNQMVNYLAIKNHNIKKVYNITRKKNEKYKVKFDYEKWDKRLKNSLAKVEVEDVLIDNIPIKDHETTKSSLKKLLESTEKILWNITGGQRHIIMTILDMVKDRKNDTIVYFDGDEELYFYYDCNMKDITGDKILNEDISLNIPLALKLMGFQVTDELETSKYYKFLTENKNDELEKEFDMYVKLYNKYVFKKELRKTLIESNKDDFKDARFKHITSYIKDENVLEDSDIEILEKSLGDYKKGYVFGYILERMAFYKIISLIREEGVLEKIADIGLSVKIDNEKKDKIDEFDILLLTKKGKVIMFECKSGGMTGDNAKSNNYSTYAISGVYGTPTLISPIIENEKIENLNIPKAINAARKANLEVIYIDELKTFIKNI